MNNCEFWLERDGKPFKCCNEADAIIRRSDVCYTHYHFLLRDNKARINKEIDIPDSFEYIIRILPSQSKRCNIELSDKPIKEPPIEEEIGDYSVEVIIE